MFGPTQLAKMGAEESGEKNRLFLYEAKRMPGSWSPPEKEAWVTSTGLAKGSSPQ